jgi:glycerophosphoryl diester phosphodiesterase
MPEHPVTHKRSGAMPPETVEIIAHRGYSALAPENTRAALRAAVEAGADAVEFDLHVAACGTPVLFHDGMLSRTTDGVGPLRRRTLAQLKALDAGAWFSPEFSGETIPSFAEALQDLARERGRIYAEVKEFRELEDLDRMVSVARDAQMLERVVFISLNWTVLERLRGRDPELLLGYVVDDVSEVEEALGRTQGDPTSLLDLRADLVLDDPDVVDRAESQGTEVAVWTVDDPSEASRLLDLGVRRITTNQVERLVAWREST